MDIEQNYQNVEQSKVLFRLMILKLKLIIYSSLAIVLIFSVLSGHFSRTKTISISFYLRSNEALKHVFIFPI